MELFLNGPSIRYQKEPFKAKINPKYGLYIHDINWLSLFDPIPHHAHTDSVIPIP